MIKKVSWVPQKHGQAGQLFSTWIIIIGIILWAVNQHIRLISEGSCDNDDWDDAENSSLHHRNKLYFKIIKYNISLSNIFLNNISKYYSFYINK